MIKGWLNTNITPERLLENYISTGDTVHVVKLVELFNLSLYHYVLSLSDKETAEDIIQLTWLKVMKIQSMNKQHTNVKSWLFTVARNTLIDELRRQKKWQFQSLETQNLSSPSLIEEYEENTRLALFNHAVNKLPFHQREAFIFQQEGFSVYEICQLTNENFEAIKSRLRYARKNLKAMLGHHNE
jgi:RNA polymerase sigma factor (sigma-70 family)